MGETPSKVLPCPYSKAYRMVSSVEVCTMSSGTRMPGNSQWQVEYVMEAGAVVHYSFCLAAEVSVLYGIVK